MNDISIIILDDSKYGMSENDDRKKLSKYFSESYLKLFCLLNFMVFIFTENLAISNTLVFFSIQLLTWKIKNSSIMIFYGIFEYILECPVKFNFSLWVLFGRTGLKISVCPRHFYGIWNFPFVWLDFFQKKCVGFAHFDCLNKTHSTCYNSV